MSRNSMAIVEYQGYRFRVRRRQLDAYLSQHPGSVVIEQAWQPGAASPEFDQVAHLMEMRRPELDEYAVQVGIENPSSLPNKRAVAEAIAAQSVELE